MDHGVRLLRKESASGRVNVGAPFPSTTRISKFDVKVICLNAGADTVCFRKSNRIS